MPKRDFTQIAFAVVQRATGDASVNLLELPSRKGGGALIGKTGGKARAASLTSDKRSAIAKKAAKSRWDAKRAEDAKAMPAFPPAKKKRIGA